MQSKDYGQYFVPKQAYVAEDLSAAAAVHGGLLCIKSCRVSRIMFFVTTLVAADTTAPAVELNKRPTAGSATGEVSLGTITIPDTTAVSKVIYKDIDPVSFVPGDEISFEHTVQAADAGTAAGAGYYGFEFDDDPDYVVNQTNMVATA